MAQIVLKTEAISSAGDTKCLADMLGMSSATVRRWPCELSARDSAAVIGALVLRHGVSGCAKRLPSTFGPYHPWTIGHAAQWITPGEFPPTAGFLGAFRGREGLHFLRAWSKHGKLEGTDGGPIMQDWSHCVAFTLLGELNDS